MKSNKFILLGVILISVCITLLVCRYQKKVYQERLDMFIGEPSVADTLQTQTYMNIVGDPTIDSFAFEGNS